MDALQLFCQLTSAERERAAKRALAKKNRLASTKDQHLANALAINAVAINATNNKSTTAANQPASMGTPTSPLTSPNKHSSVLPDNGGEVEGVTPGVGRGGQGGGEGEGEAGAGVASWSLTAGALSGAEGGGGGGGGEEGSGRYLGDSSAGTVTGGWQDAHTNTDEKTHTQTTRDAQARPQSAGNLCKLPHNSALC
jgi:hypothetical protein